MPVLYQRTRVLGDTARTYTAWRCCWDGHAKAPTVQRYDLSHLPWYVGDQLGSAAAPAWVGIGDSAQELIFEFGATVHPRARAHLGGDGGVDAADNAPAGVDAQDHKGFGRVDTGPSHWAYHLESGTLTRHDAYT